MSKKFFLLDTNVIVDYYLGDESSVKKVFNELLEARKQGRCLIFVPNFCIGEAFSTFAREYCYKNAISKIKFEKVKWDFVDQVSRDYEYKRKQFFSHIELNRYHLFNAHLVYQPAWEFLRKEHQAKRLTDRNGNPKFPTTFDLLVIAQGIEMTYLYSDNDFAILTSDKVMIAICRHLRTLNHADRVSYIKRSEVSQEHFQNLSAFKYPEVVNARNYTEFRTFSNR